MDVLLGMLVLESVHQVQFGPDRPLGSGCGLLDGLNDLELDRVLNAAQMVDSEAQDLFERRRDANQDTTPANSPQKGAPE